MGRWGELFYNSPIPPGLIHGHQIKLTGWGDKGTRRQGDKGKDDFSVVCIISPSQINFSVENELAL
ncbi:hypothetical protein, partial [[Phormidium] sp. LEGE 05292]|uniref:hypothetical protein n=1 Tax=[Phormidium] sp. LEGE 05292 TaxID=767427 RepID=UPI001D142D2E